MDELFAELVVFEQEKSKAGLFMPDYAADAIIDQCRQFIETPEENYMIDVFETEIEAVEGLTQEQKQTYIAKNRELVTTELVAAYQSLIDGLEALKGTGTNEKGLCYYEDGKRYYKYLVESMTGSSQDLFDLLVATDQHISACIMQMQSIMIKNPNVMNDWDTYEFCETEPDKILEDLIEKIKVDFPEQLLRIIPEDKRDAAVGVLSHDPRPSYQRKPDRIYGLTFAGFDIRFQVAEDVLTVVEVHRV